MAPSPPDRSSGSERTQAVSRGARFEILPVENVDVAGAIQHLRGFRSQAELAKLARLSPSTWSLYESGGRRPSGENLSRVLKALGCSRIQFEETVWSFRRLRLLEEQGSQRQAAGQRSPGRTGVPARGSAGASRVQPLPPDLLELRTKASALLDDLVGLLARVTTGARR